MKSIFLGNFMCVFFLLPYGPMHIRLENRVGNLYQVATHTSPLASQSMKAEKDDDTESIAGPLDPPCETCPGPFSQVLGHPTPILVGGGEGSVRRFPDQTIAEGGSLTMCYRLSETTKSKKKWLVQRRHTVTPVGKRL